MSAVTRLGDICTGHGCWPPREAVEASSNVFVNGIGVHRKGDGWNIHCCNNDCHFGTMVGGSDTVFINGRSAARIGDEINCGSLSAQGSSDTFFG